MEFIGTTNFSRKIGSKDKTKRKPHILRNTAIGLAGITTAGGLAYLALKNKKPLPTAPQPITENPAEGINTIKNNALKRAGIKQLKTIKETDAFVSGGYSEVANHRLNKYIKRGQNKTGSKISSKVRVKKKVNFMGNCDVYFARKLGSKDKRKRTIKRGGYEGLNPLSIGGASALGGATVGMFIGDHLITNNTKIKNPLVKSMALGAAGLGTLGYLGAKNFNKKLGLKDRTSGL